MPTGWTPAATSSTLEEWTRTFSRRQQCSCFRTRNTFCRTRSLSNATFFIFWSRHENLMILHWDMAIYRFSKWRPSAILELFYHHTRHPRVFGVFGCLGILGVCGFWGVKFHVNLIHRSEDIAVWIFRIFGLKCLFNSPKLGFWGTLDP